MVVINKRYDALTPDELNTLFKKGEFHLLLWSDPYIFMDVYGLTDPITFNIPLLIYNNETIPLYFKVKGSSSVADYNFPETQLGSVGANSKALLNYTFTRTHPGTLPSPITETINITVEAYEDDAYTQLYGSETLQFTVELFDRTQGTVIDIDGFEADLDGWVGNKTTLKRTTEKAFEGAYSMTFDRDSTPPDYYVTPEKYDNRYAYKSLDTTPYTSVYMVAHALGNHSIIYRRRTVIYGGDYVLRFVLPSANVWYRLCYKLPIDASATVKIWLYKWYGGGAYIYYDYVIFVGW